MDIQKAKEMSFDKKSFEDWQEIASQSLKGLPFERLISKTIEGIDLQPLYTKQNVQCTAMNDIRSQLNKDWTIAQMQYARKATDFLSELQLSLARGNEAIVYDGRHSFNWNESQIQDLSDKMIAYPIYFYNVDEEDGIWQAFKKIPAHQRNHVRGVVQCLPNNKILANFEHVRWNGINTIPFHHQGADVVTELALVLSYAAEQLTRYDSFELFNKQFYVRFAIDTHFFMEIAKLRAFKLLWQAFTAAYEKQYEQVPIIAETSTRSFSLIDPYVNLLRAGNSAFSAVLGGVDVLTVHPHDLLTTPSQRSIRIARNVQIVIKEETFVNQVVDPSGGSYFIESLTKDLIDKGWQRFLQIEEEGGFTEYVNSNSFQDELNRLYKKRIQLIATGEHSLVGTSVYTDLNNVEQIKETRFIEGRLAQPFEKYRAIFQEKQPRITLIPFGQLKDYKQRLDFITSFFAAGSLKTVQSPSFHLADEAVEWIKENKLDYIVICASHEDTLTVLPNILPLLPKTVKVDVVGKYDEETMNKWSQLGVQDFIYPGKNKLKKYKAIYTQWKGE